LLIVQSTFAIRAVKADQRLCRHRGLVPPRTVTTFTVWTHQKNGKPTSTQAEADLLKNAPLNASKIALGHKTTYLLCLCGLDSFTFRVCVAECAGPARWTVVLARPLIDSVATVQFHDFVYVFVLGTWQYIGVRRNLKSTGLNCANSKSWLHD
jgi:hypothetical protein